MALEEIAYVMRELHYVREAGFSEQALNYPRSHFGLIALCAFNGIEPSMAPPGWKYWPNEAMKKSWTRVIRALVNEGFKMGQEDAYSRVANRPGDGDMGG